MKPAESNTRYRTWYSLISSWFLGSRLPRMKNQRGSLNEAWWQAGPLACLSKRREG